MSTLVLILITGSVSARSTSSSRAGLSLIYGLMGVLNFAHGSFLTLGAFIGWQVAQALGDRRWGLVPRRPSPSARWSGRSSRRSPNSCSSVRSTSGTSSRCS